MDFETIVSRDTVDRDHRFISEISLVVWLFTSIYLRAQTAVGARITVILITGQTRIPPIEAPCREENDADSCSYSILDHNFS